MTAKHSNNRENSENFFLPANDLCHGCLHLANRHCQNSVCGAAHGSPGGADEMRHRQCSIISDVQCNAVGVVCIMAALHCTKALPLPFLSSFPSSMQSLHCSCSSVYSRLQVPKASDQRHKRDGTKAEGAPVAPKCTIIC